MPTSTPSEPARDLGAEPPQQLTSEPLRRLAAAWRPTPLSALELRDIPTELHFVRDHFAPPTVDSATWRLDVRGSARSLILDARALRSLPRRTLNVVLECAGHRRAEFQPMPPGLPWSAGAICEARWSGASLAAVLELVGVPVDAAEVVLEGADAGQVDGFEGNHRFARSLPLEKAFDRDVLLADEMNGEPIRLEHGGPVRVIVPGWYATDSVKWIDRIWFTAEPFGGVFQAHDYRFREPGDPGPGRRMTALPVSALITTPGNGDVVLAGDDMPVRGAAWGGTGEIAEVLVQVDGGAWSPACLARATGRYAKTNWEVHYALSPGKHEIACRAIDGAGQAQPDLPPQNAQGYANNAIHRVTIEAV
jgi:DMSO/TMAO reductase YedYZ molybdopterin-dependent catalytic subunit